MGELTYDVLVVGAGPAGAVAAARLAAQGHAVVVVEASGEGGKLLCAGWLNAKAKPLLLELKIPLKDIGARPFRSVTFYNVDFSKSAVPHFAEAPGYLIERARLDKRLVRAATDAGATLIEGRRVTDVALGELLVTLQLDEGEPLQGRLLIVAAGRGSELLERLQLGPGAFPAGWWAAHVDADNVVTKGEPRFAIVLGLDELGGFGMITAGNGRASVGVQMAAGKDKVVPAIIRLCTQAVEHGILSVDLCEQAARAQVIMTPAAVALAMDTHVAKRALMVGDAGGFVSATSGEGIYPAMWSARIAAEVIHQALEDPSPQDVLMGFDTRWRTQMADHLRAPGTDTQYILPLVFSNQPMADRMGAAFFCGENI
ncbi:MAG: NAD(P)/FAD-dependent oxidoreductase [Phycisphaerae bacterium]